MEFSFEAPVFLWSAKESAWFFTTVPEELSVDIREIPRPTRGFGSVRVQVQLGATTWRTSIFPDSASGCYVLPLKKAVRDAEGITEDSTVNVVLQVLDV